MWSVREHPETDGPPFPVPSKHVGPIILRGAHILHGSVWARWTHGGSGV